MHLFVLNVIGLINAIRAIEVWISAETPRQKSTASHRARDIAAVVPITAGVDVTGQWRASALMRRLGLNVIEVNVGQNDAVMALQKGEIAATVRIDGKPAAPTTKLKASEGFRILPIAYDIALQNDFGARPLSE